MDKLDGSRLFTAGLVIGATVGCLFVSFGLAQPAQKTSSEGTVYHADPQHLWNRLYDDLFVRVGSDGGTYGRDRFEPLLWLGSRHLLAGPSHERGVKLLKEFLDKHGEKLIEDPLKRALLQRDLWMVFSWLHGMHVHSGDSGIAPDKLGEAKKRLGRPLAAVIRRLALSREQIKKLPDNYADAVKAGRFAKSHASEKPDAPYLPPDLFSADGRWVCVGRAQGPPAPEHLRKENTLANSAFLIFLRLPGGRGATLKYLKRGTGDLPAGAEVALVRRAVLIARSAEITPTNLVESIQLRVYGETGQSVSEFRLSRGLLFAGQTGGLHAVGSNERDFKTGFGAGTYDQFEEPLVGQDLAVRRVDIKNECTGCHNRDRFPGLRARESGPLLQATVADTMGIAVKWKQERPDWKALRKLLAE
ncbi:MAG TPA: hypothetical protein VG013_03975 [Gemmataceae bacterium]|jgi:hypothetical protein|nr:hypothetical protein [Gemmataceae bacterium]